MLAVPTKFSVFAATTTRPLAWAVTRPAGLTEAMASFDEDQVNILFGITPPLELYAVARSWSRPPTVSVSAAGLITTARTTKSAGAGSGPTRWSSAASCRDANSRLAARHLFVLLNPTAAAAVPTAVHVRPPTMAASLFHIDLDLRPQRQHRPD